MGIQSKIIWTLLHYNLLPDFALRWLVRLGVSKTAAVECDDSDPEATAERMQLFVDDLKNRDVAVHQNDANQQHYELPPEFFETVLGPRLKYSCCYFGKDFGITKLADSEIAMLKLCCDRAHIENGMKVLDLGCGWGSFAIYIAQTFSDCQVTALSNSGPQGEFIRRKCSEQGLTNVKVITADASTFQSHETYDRIVSCEMFEHMKNYELLLQKLSMWLREDGKLFVHIFTNRKLPYHFERGWMARTFFTGGMMPSSDLLLWFQRHLVIDKVWAVSGRHYERTCNEWLKLMDANKNLVRRIITDTYGSSNAQKWYVNWRLFFIVCAENFGYNGGKDWIVSHYLFKKRDLS